MPGRCDQRVEAQQPFVDVALRFLADVGDDPSDRLGGGARWPWSAQHRPAPAGSSSRSPRAAPTDRVAALEELPGEAAGPSARDRLLAYWRRATPRSASTSTANACCRCAALLPPDWRWRTCRARRGSRCRSPFAPAARRGRPFPPRGARLDRSQLSTRRRGRGDHQHDEGERPVDGRSALPIGSEETPRRPGWTRSGDPGSRIESEKQEEGPAIEGESSRALEGAASDETGCHLRGRGGSSWNGSLSSPTRSPGGPGQDDSDNHCRLRWHFVRSACRGRGRGWEDGSVRAAPLFDD